MILAQGEVVYYGEARGVIPYFGELGYPLPEHTNPADHFSKITTLAFSLSGAFTVQVLTLFPHPFSVNLVHVDHSNPDTAKMVKDFVQKYRESDKFKELRLKEVEEHPPVCHL
jgi:hypothetical protein